MLVTHWQTGQSRAVFCLSKIRNFSINQSIKSIESISVSPTNKIIDIQQKKVISNHILTVSVVGVSILCGCIFSCLSRLFYRLISISVSYISQYLCPPQLFWLFQVLEAFRLEICRDRRDQVSCNLFANCVICLHYLRRARKFTHIFHKFELEFKWNCCSLTHSVRF